MHINIIISKNWLLSGCLTMMLAYSTIMQTGMLLAQGSASTPTFAMAIHGGAGTIRKENLTPELEAAYEQKLREALQAGLAVLKGGGRSIDAVQTAIVIMEDSPLFNAGKGAVFTADASHEMDASIMDGATLQAGAVAAVQHIKNPIKLARLVLEKSPHVMLTGDGAENFAGQHDLETVTQDYFFTQRRWDSLLKQKAKQAEQAAPEKGTVGAVALDQQGNLAAATSTGGMTNKLFGRVGDSPIIGAGTYANNATCAVSGTGHGEYFMRLLVAHDIHALMAYEGLSVADAADRVISKKLTELGGTGGVIAVDKNGNIAMPFNTPGMYRGYANSDGTLIIKIYKD